MKKIIFTSTLSFFFSIALFAQKKNSLELSFGPSFAVGAFGGRNLDNPKSGYAGVGQQLNVTYTYMLTRKFGLTGSLYAQRNMLNRKQLNERFQGTNIGNSVVFSTFVDPMIPQPSNYPSAYFKDWNFEKRAWLAASLLFGVTVDLPFNQTGKLSFVASGMAGITAVKSPKLDGKANTDTSMAYFTQTSKSGFGLGFLTRAGLKYNVNKRIGLLLTADYASSSAVVFKNMSSTITVIQNSGGGLGTTSVSQAKHTGNAEQTLQAVNINAGIVFHL